MGNVLSLFFAWRDENISWIDAFSFRWPLLYDFEGNCGGFWFKTCNSISCDNHTQVKAWGLYITLGPMFCSRALLIQVLFFPSFRMQVFQHMTTTHGHGRKSRKNAKVRPIFRSNGATV